MPQHEHVKLFYQPKIWVTSEHAAAVLGISLEKADQLLSGPDTYEIVKQSLLQDLQASLLRVLQQMIRQRWPQEVLPIRVDCQVDLPPLPTLEISGLI